MELAIIKLETFLIIVSPDNRYGSFIRKEAFM